MTTWLITGCSTGLGRALSQTVLAHGHNAVVTARNVNAVKDIPADYPDTALALPLDVTDKEQISSAVQQAQARFGGIDVLVNSAGYGYRAAVEEADDDDIRHLFDTNLFGAVDMAKAVLPSNPERSAPISPAGHSRSRRRRFRIMRRRPASAARRTTPSTGPSPETPARQRKRSSPSSKARTRRRCWSSARTHTVRLPPSPTPSARNWTSGGS